MYPVLELLLLEGNLHTNRHAHSQENSFVDDTFDASQSIIFVDFYERARGNRHFPAFQISDLPIP